MNAMQKLAAFLGRTPTAPLKPFTIRVADNFHYQDESETYTHGSYESIEAAVAVCQQIVLDSLRIHLAKPGMSGDELYNYYVSFGDDPYVIGPGIKGVPFSAWTFAKARCAEFCAPPLQPAVARRGTPQQQKAIDEWRASLGQSLVDNLNRNVLRQNEPAPVRPLFLYAYFLALATVGAALVLLAAH
jgi:hypothetical protein